MRWREFLVEYNRAVTARQFGDKIFNQWQKELSPDTVKYPLSARELDSFVKGILQSIEEEDPTPNKQYVPWLAREYGKGNIRRLEDMASRFKPALERFHKAKNTRAFADYLTGIDLPQAKDISKIDAATFIDMMQGFKDPREKLADKGESRTVYEDSDVTVIVPLDQAAACYYGQDTYWCTAEREGRNYFDQYNEEGPLYIIIPKNPRTPEERYQLHFESMQFMDEKDSPVPLYTLKRFPGLVEYFKKNIKDFNYFIEFEDPKILKELHFVAVGLIEDQVRAQIEEWAEKDTDYQDFLKAWAPDGQGGIDWNKVNTSYDLQYENYDRESKKLIREINDMDSWSPEEIIKRIQLYEDSYTLHGGWLNYLSYGKFYNYVLRQMIDDSKKINIFLKSLGSIPRNPVYVGPYVIGSDFIR